MIARVATAQPIEAAVNGLPLGPITVAPFFRQLSASNMSPVITTVFESAVRDPVVRGVERFRDQHPLDQRMLGHPDARVADHPHRHPAPPGDAIDLVFHRTGVRVDQNADALRQCARTVASG